MILHKCVWIICAFAPIGLYISRIAFIAIALLLICLDCFSRILGDFWGIVRALCAFAVVLSLSLCRESLKFCPCWLFVCLGVFLLGLVAFVRLCAVFEPRGVCARFVFCCACLCSVRLASRRCALAVRDGRVSQGVPLPYFARACVVAVLPNTFHIKK